jgi:hypothetical protein
MNPFKLVTFTVLFFAFFLTGYSQKANIEMKDKTVTTSILEFGDNGIFTDNGYFLFSEISQIIFEKFDPAFQSTYSNLKNKVSISFGNRPDIEKTTPNPDAISELLKIKELSDKVQIYPEDYLIKGSRSALTGIALSGLGVILAVVGAGTDDVGEELSIVGGALGIGGLGLVIDGWVKIGKAGKAMKAERLKKKQSN